MPQLLRRMQKRVHDYVVADKGTAKEALDLLIEDWTEDLQGRRQDLATSDPADTSRQPRLVQAGELLTGTRDMAMLRTSKHPRAIRRPGRRRDAGTRRRGACAASRTGRSPGCSSRRRSSSCSRSTSFR